MQLRKIGLWTMLLVSTTFISDRALAFMSFSLSGKVGSSTIPLQNSETRSGSGTIDFDMGQYMRLGFTYQQDYTTKEGYTLISKADPDLESSYTKYSERSIFTMKSIDLTLILYSGELFMPYIFGGVARIETQTKLITDDGDPQYTTSIAPMVPTGGAGFGLRLNKQFTLKFSNRWIPGTRQLKPLGKTEPVVDTQMQVGISYQL